MPVNTILGLFAKSPIKPLQKHIAKVHQCCEQLLPFFMAVAEDRWDEATVIYGQINQMEKEADVLKREIRLKLPSGLFMPLARTDLLEMLTQQDKIANRAKDICGIMLGRKLTFPADLSQDFQTYIKRCLDATELAVKAIGELDELLETGFRGRELQLVEEMVKQLDVIEDDTDQLQIGIRRKIFARENEFNPVDVIFLYKVLEKIGDLADQADRVGARLELMLARN
ncbi:MAG: TIGR00153 family protein [Aeromonadaceae bacterium]|nr:TIGR00153 family protein [Aeromonadaceae bacterium]